VCVCARGFSQVAVGVPSGCGQVGVRYVLASELGERGEAQRVSGQTGVCVCASGWASGQKGGRVKRAGGRVGRIGLH
jgi:hypothetical protein